MKKILFIILLFAGLQGSAQVHFLVHAAQQPLATLQNDTLFITPGACKFIKIGDKIYELKTSIEEVKTYVPPIPISSWEIASPYIDTTQTPSENEKIPTK